MKIQEIDLGQEQPKRVVRKRKRIKKDLKWLKRVLVFLLVVAAAVLLALSPVFIIEKIEVAGNTHYDNRDIVNATKLVTGVNGFKEIGSNILNIFTLRYGGAEAEIKRNFSYVEDCKVRFILPGKIRIAITERTAFAFIPYGGTRLVIDNAAIVLDTAEKNGKIKLPGIKGLKFQSFTLGQALKLENGMEFEKVNLLIDTFREVDAEDNYKLFAHVSSIDVSEPQKISLTVNGRITANFGTLHDLRYKIRFFKEIIKNKVDMREKGYLDMTLDNPVFQLR